MESILKSVRSCYLPPFTHFLNKCRFPLFPFILLNITPGFSYRLSVIMRFLISSLPCEWCSPTLWVIWSEIFLHRVSSCHLFVFLLPSWRQDCSVVIRPSSRVTFFFVALIYRFFIHIDCIQEEAIFHKITYLRTNLRDCYV